MNTSVVVTLLGTASIMLVAVITIVVAQRANRAQALAAAKAVDAGAYVRAKDIYEAALEAARAERESLIGDLHEAREDLRAARADMRELRESNDRLLAEVRQLRAQLGT
jgi:chromosome segregation ATPase